jgi:L-rhamnono-1,4-lactonase
VGFRFLLQGKREGEVGALVGSTAWLENVVALGKGRGGRGWVFDVGVDTHRDGVEGLELVAGMVDEVRRRERGAQHKVRFVISMLPPPPPSFLFLLFATPF